MGASRLMTKIDPEIRRFVLTMRNDWRQFPSFESMTYPQQRAAAETVRARWREGGPRMADTQEVTFDPGAGELTVRIYRPVATGRTLPALVYLHGGGFTLFSIDTHDRLMREYAAAGGFAVVGVAYPLAPESKYPVALGHIEALLLWIKNNGPHWNIDPARIAIGGDSAGGNLAFAASLRLRDRNELGLINAILSNYGGFSSEISDESERRFGGSESIMDRAEAEQYWGNYLRGPHDAADPYACPLLADLHDFPPVILVVPELDIVAEQSLMMEQRLSTSGVSVECNVYPGAVHSFLEAMSISSLARRAIADGAEFIRRHTA